MCGFGGKLDKFRRGRYFTSQHRAQVFITADGLPRHFQDRPARGGSGGAKFPAVGGAGGEAVRSAVKSMILHGAPEAELSRGEFHS